MALINREKDASEQREVILFEQAPVATGTTLVAWTAPYPCTVQQVIVSCLGFSGAPTLTFNTARFIVGTGATTLTGVAGVLTPTAFGTSGALSSSMGVSLQAAGSSLLNLQTQDVLTITSGGSNAAIASLSVEFVIKKTQDILQVWGQTT
jgi:hypothetical protein